MSRVVVFGGDGILGSHLYLALNDAHELSVTVHQPKNAYPAQLFSKARVEYAVAAGDTLRVAAVLDAIRPDWVLNAVGLVKRDRAEDACASLEANTMFPHLLARLCADRSVRLLHFSTDCVFSGTRGMYRESDPPDNADWHGRCKALGEPAGEHVLVLRSSFIGLELQCKRSLLEWFLAQRGMVRGYRKAIWSGLPAIEIARLASKLVQRVDPIAGTWHVAAPPVSKHALLMALNSRLAPRDMKLVADDSFVCDRSLDGRAFSARSGFVAPDWAIMLDELAQDVRQRWRPDAPSYWAF